MARSADLSLIESAKRKVAMLTNDVQVQEKYLALYVVKLDNTKAYLQSAKKELEELEKVV